MFVSIILAAGLSTRFPGNKLLYLWEGKPVIYWTVSNVLDSSVDKVFVVTGYERPYVLKALEELGGRFVEIYNPYYVQGMSSSVKTGVMHVIEYYGDEVTGVFITPGDCAWIPGEAYDLLINVYREKKRLILIAGYDGVKGHPILFDKSLLSEIINISEETMGLKSILNKYRYDVLLVNTPYPGVVLDLDTYNDLNRVKYMLKK